MLHILVTAMNDALEDLPSDPPFPAIRPPPAPRQALPPPPQASADKAVLSSNASMTGQRAPKHWSPSAHEQQQESMQLLRQQEALHSEKTHAKTQTARQKLPAFSKRQELLSQLSQNSVVVISGATGDV